MSQSFIKPTRGAHLSLNCLLITLSRFTRFSYKTLTYEKKIEYLERQTKTVRAKKLKRREGRLSKTAKWKRGLI
jgi:hypothetical protein